MEMRDHLSLVPTICGDLEERKGVDGVRYLPHVDAQKVEEIHVGMCKFPFLPSNSYVHGGVVSLLLFRDSMHKENHL